VSRPDGRHQPLDIQRPAVDLAQLVEGHVGTGRTSDFVEALIARPGHDGVKAGAEHHVEQAEDGLLGAAEDEHLVGRDRLVEVGDLAAQERVAGRLRVAERQTVPEGPRLLVGELQELRHRVALDVRGAEQVLDRELPAGEVAFQGEVFDVHPRMMPHPGRGGA
jgi:hypothetical protein